MNQILPWWLLMFSKMVLSRVPLKYDAWRKLNLFRHGAMDDLNYAQAVFLTHFNLSPLATTPTPFSCLELGPGDSLLSAIIARQYGSTHTYLVDTGDFARKDANWYRRVAQSAPSLASGVFHPDHWTSIEAMLVDCRAMYLTEGLQSLGTIPTASFDFVWSHAVLEHVRRRDLAEVVSQLRRVSKTSAFGSHRIDLQDHLGGGLNSLRFSERTWEGDLLSSSGFYTNRFRYSEMLAHFVAAGFRPQVVDRELWPRLPLPRHKMHGDFQRFTDEDLRTYALSVTLTIT
jgi:hypothetical protein